MSPKLIPDVYVTLVTPNGTPITGLPLNWRDEVSGKLPAAVKAYLDNRVDRTPIGPEHLEWLRVYFEHYINAPCWDSEDGNAAELLADLRRDVKELKTPEAIGEWIWRCLDLGIDPL